MAKNKFKKRIGTIFSDLLLGCYKENPEGHRYKKGRTVSFFPSPWIEFQLVPAPGTYIYGIELSRLNALAKLLGTETVEVSGWSDGPDLANTIAITVYDVKF